MIGGDNFRESQFNLAVQGERQPGSSFKPFVLATALEDGISPVTEFDSKPVEIFTGDRVWVVHNYEGSYIGRANLQTATTYSDNSIYAQLTDLVGPAAGRQDRARDGDHEPAQGLPLDRARRAGGQPAGDGARLLDLRQRRLPDRRRDHRQSRARDRLDRRERLAAAAAARTRRSRSGRSARPPRRSSTPSSRPSSPRAPASARSSRTAGRSPARPGRRRTTATPGSSDTRRSSSPPCGSATRTI